jgi:hypothetical protein
VSGVCPVHRSDRRSSRPLDGRHPSPAAALPPVRAHCREAGTTTETWRSSRPGYPITFKMSEASAAYWRQNELRGVRLRSRNLRHRPRLGRQTTEQLPEVRGHSPAAAGELARLGRTPFTFVDNLEDALEQARAAADARTSASRARASPSRPLTWACLTRSEWTWCRMRTGVR